MSQTITQSDAPDIAGERGPTSLISIKIRTPNDLLRGPEPIRQGVPLARGAVKDEATIVLVDEAGGTIPVQTRVLSRWVDGSIQWVLLDFMHSMREPNRQSSTDGICCSTYFVEAQDSAQAIPSTPQKSSVPVKPIAEVDSGWGAVAVGAMEQTGSFFGIDQDWIGQIRVRLIDGRDLRLKVSRTQTLESGPIRTVVEVSGDLLDASQEKILDCRFEIHLFAELRLLRLTATLCNPLAATHPGGIWELGDSRSVEIAEASIVLRPQGNELTQQTGSARWSVDGSNDLESSDLPWSLYQDSSGGDQWDSSSHVDRDGKVPLRFRGYELTTGDTTTRGNRATPVVEYRIEDRTAIAVSVPQFWQNFPKSLSLTESELRVGLFPTESNRPHELQPGEQKTHQFWIGGKVDKGSDRQEQVCSAVASVHKPSTVVIDPAAIAASDVIPWLTPKAADPHATYLSLVDAAIEGSDTYFQKRETIDEYGWRHFGDIYGDHEAVFSPANPPLISHYNNQYDVVLGFGIQYLRGGDQHWIEMMRDLAWHVVDIDIYHSTTDKNAYNGGQFWHTFHYIDAGTATHRSYPAGTCGGGPASEQGYARGLGLYYFLTGEELMRQTVDRMGDWIIAADDGSRTPFRWLSSNGTGLTSASGTLDYQGPGRGAGNAIELLVATFEVTGRKKVSGRSRKTDSTSHSSAR